MFKYFILFLISCVSLIADILTDSQKDLVIATTLDAYSDVFELMIIALSFSVAFFIIRSLMSNIAKGRLYSRSTDLDFIGSFRDSNSVEWKSYQDSAGRTFSVRDQFQLQQGFDSKSDIKFNKNKFTSHPKDEIIDVTWTDTRPNSYRKLIDHELKVNN